MTDKEKEPLNQATPGDERLCEECPDVSSPGLVVPPDGGYGWVIMAASFFVNFLVDGVCFSFGIFYLEFLDHYGESKEKTSWVGSVMNGMYLSMGPLVGALANKFGCRRVSMIGSLVAAGALILSTFSPNIYMLILLYGALTGFGFGLMYLPAIVMVGYYFEKRRALATGIAVCGSGIGGFVFAPMCEKLIEVYAWKGATWIVAGLCLNGMVCGALFMPLEPPKKKRIYNTRIVKEENATCGTTEVLQIKPRPAEVKHTTDDPRDILKEKMKRSATSDGVKGQGVIEDTSTNLVRSMHDLSPSCIVDSQQNSCVSKSCDDLRVCLKVSNPNTADESRDINRPMYRKDIFYSGSIQNLPQYKASDNMDNYVRSVTSIPENIPPQKVGLCKSLTDTLKEMMDFHVLQNPVFSIYGLSCFLCMIGFFVPFTYLPDVATSFGFSKSQAAFLVSIIGIANTVARVACGWISDQPWADCLIINNCALVLGGVATILCPFCITYGLLGTYSFVFGSCIAAFVSLRSIIMVDLMGLEKLTSAFGLVTLCQGLSSFIGAPIAGALFDATGYYNLSFYVAGTTLALAGIICFPLRRIALCRRKRLLLKEAKRVVPEVMDVTTRSSADNNAPTLKENGETAQSV